MQLPREVIVGDNVLGKVGETCTRLGFSGSVLIVTDSNVQSIGAAPARESLESSGFKVQEVQYSRLLLSKADLPVLKQSAVVRLMELFNMKVEKVTPESIAAHFHSENYAEAKKANAPLVHWLPEEHNCRTTVVMPTAEKIDGLGEPALTTCHLDEVIQLVRFGFGRIDTTAQNSVTIYFAHQ
jgi:hypothetical protein